MQCGMCICVHTHARLYSTLPVFRSSSCRQYVNTWAHLRANKALLTNTGCEPDVVHGPCSAQTTYPGIEQPLLNSRNAVRLSTNFKKASSGQAEQKLAEGSEPGTERTHGRDESV